MWKTNLALKKTKTVSEKMEIVDKRMEWNFDFRWHNTITEKKNKKILENRFRSDIDSVLTYREKTIYPSRFQSIKDYTLDVSDRKRDLIKKKREYLTNEKQPIVRTYVDRLLQSIFRTQFFVKAYPLSQKKVKKTKQAIISIP